MNYTVGDLIADVDRKLHSGGTSQTQDFYGALDEARRNMIGKVRPPELIRKAYLENAIYDQIDRYAVPNELKYEDVIDIKMLSANRNLDTMWDPIEQVYRRRFDQKRRNAKNVFAITYQDGVKYMQLHHPRGLQECRHLLVNDANSLSQNGTWNVGGNVVNLQLDQLRYITGKGALRFDFNTSGNAGFLENHSMNAVDLHEYLATGSIFTWLDVSNYLGITSVKITLGSDQSNLNNDLYTFTVNRPHDDNQFINDWNLLKFPLESMTVTGTPNPRAINYVRLDFTTTGIAMQNYRVDNIVARKGAVYEMLYNSSYCFIDPANNVWKKKASANSDIMPFEEDSYNILMLELALVILKEAYSNDAGAQSDVNDIKDELKEKYKTYRGEHKSEAIAPFESVYIMGNFADGYQDDSLDDGWGNRDNNSQGDNGN